MGGVFSSLWSRLFGSKEVRMLILGLDNAGKTTILHRLHSGEAVHTVPTIGFEVETVMINNVKIQVWDLGGQSSIRPYWRCYAPNTSGLVYVVDACDKDRLAEAGTELGVLLQEHELRDVPLLILANKQDLPDAASANEVSDKLGLAEISDREYFIAACSALEGRGIREGLDWLVQKMATS
jgi:ADP-ribosylation factor-like protein 1